MKKSEHICPALLILIFFSASLVVFADDNQEKWLAISGIEQHTGLALTVYNNNLGLVKDQRKINLPKGSGEIRFMDVASKIIPESVGIKSLVKPESLIILEQNYEYDLLNPGKLLDKYVGKEIKLYQKNPYTEREEVVSATLLANNKSPVFQIGEEITFDYPGRIIFPSVPENLISEPTLVWLAENKLKEEQMVEASYLTEGISWKADYVLTLNEKDDMADLAGWVTIDNKSGATYRDARLKLVAGDVNKVGRDTLRKRERSFSVMAEAAEPRFREEGFFEYHMYSLQRQTTVKDNEIKQISLINADSIKIGKEFRLYGNSFEYGFDENEDNNKRYNAGVFIEIANKKENGLGMPLPKGTVRLYKKDSEGSLQFIGEDSINHTPENEKITLKTGNAFDIAGERKKTYWKQITDDTYEAAFEIAIRNHKKEGIVVKVIESVPGDWTITQSSHEYRKTDASTAEFSISIPKDGETKLTYSVRVRQ